MALSNNDLLTLCIWCGWVSHCCLAPSHKFCSYIMARTSEFSMRWWWGPLCTRPTRLVLHCKLVHNSVHCKLIHNSAFHPLLFASILQGWIFKLWMLLTSYFIQIWNLIETQFQMTSLAHLHKCIMSLINLILLSIQFSSMSYFVYICRVKGECQFYKHPIYLHSQNINNQTSINIYKNLPSNQHNLIP
jgi:hypothetical protein